MGQYMQVLKNRDFLLLWLGQGVSSLGSRIHGIALLLLVAQLTGSATGVSLLFMAMTIPRIIIFPLAGVLVERWPKKQVIVITDILQGLVAIGLALTKNIGVIYVLSSLMIIFRLFFEPAILTVMPRIVPKDELITANALSAMTSRSTSLIGPAVGGVLIAAFGLKAAFIINGVSFLFSAISELFIRIPIGAYENTSRSSRNIWREFLDGWDYIKQTKVIRFVVLFFAATGIPFGAIMVLKVVLLTEILGFSSEQYGLLMSIEGAGLLAGSFIMGAFGRKYPEVTTMIFGVGAIGALYMAIAYSPVFWLAAALLFTLGLSGTITNIAYSTFLQKAVADEFRGRVFSFDIALGEMTSFASMGLAGVLGDAFGVSNVLAVCGLSVLLMCVLAARLPAHRQAVLEVSA